MTRRVETQLFYDQLDGYYKVPPYLSVRVTTNCQTHSTHFVMNCLLCVVLKSGHVVKWIRNKLEVLKRDAGEGWRRCLDRSCEKRTSVKVESNRQEFATCNTATES
jgi:hypothetical protein